MGRGGAAAGAGAAPGLGECPHGTGWLGQPPSGPGCAGPCASFPGCQVSGGEKGGKAAGDGVDHGLPVVQARWGGGCRGTLAEGWHRSPQLPVPSCLWASAWGDAASAWHVCGEGRTSWLVLAALS